MIIIKQHSSVTLLRLYGHIFRFEVMYHFLEGGLYPYIDYSLWLGVSPRGVMTLEIVPYTPEAKKIAIKVPALPLDLLDEVFDHAITHIATERGHLLHYVHTSTKIKNALHKLHAQPWQDMDELDHINTKNRRLSLAPLYETTQPTKTNTLTVALSLSKEFTKAYPLLVPLYWQLAYAVAASTAFQTEYSSVLSRKTFRQIVKNNAFVYSMQFALIAHKPSFIDNTKLDEIGEWYSELVKDMLNDNAFKRLLEILKMTSYSNNHITNPGVLSTLDTTCVIIGSKGWQRLATEENCQQILSNIQLEVKLGRQTYSQPL